MSYLEGQRDLVSNNRENWDSHRSYSLNSSKEVIQGIIERD